MEISIMYIWLAVGVTFLAAEALGVTGVGLLFAGLGALTVGTLLNMETIAADAKLMQFIVFFASTAVWTIVLWKPMKKFRLNKHAPGYSNIVGETAYVGSAGLTKREGGEVTWSGTIMKAMLIQDAAVERMEAGTQVVIVEVKGATLIVKPKH